MAVPCGRQDDDLDEREIYRGAVSIDVVEGIGTKASKARAVAKRAGLPEKGYTIEFATRLKGEVGRLPRHATPRHATPRLTF